MPSIPSRPSSLPQEAFIADFSEGLETGLYLALLELVDEGLIITGDEVMIDANSAACRLLERDYRQIVGQSLSTLFPNEQAFLSARERLLIQGEMRGSIQVALPGDRHRELRFIAAARLRPGIHALILSPDVIAEGHKQPLHSDATSDRIWPQLAAALAQGLIVLDKAGRVQALNTTAAQLPGIDRCDIRGLALDTVLPVHWPEAHEVQIARLGPHNARILPGPHPGWRLLLLEESSHPTASAAAAAQPTSSSELQPDSLSLALCPIVDVRNGRWIGAGARHKWDGQPDSSEPHANAYTAERAATLDQCLLQAACETLASLPTRLRQRCCIVLHPYSNGDHRFAKQLRAALNASGITPKNMEIALPGAQFAQARDFSATGCGLVCEISGDDTLLPLSELARGGITRLLLAPSLIKRLGRDKKVETIIRLIVNLASTLGAEVIASGVTTLAMRDRLVVLGCYLQQGALFGPLASAEGFVAHLRGHAHSSQS